MYSSCRFLSVFLRVWIIFFQYSTYYKPENSASWQRLIRPYGGAGMDLISELEDARWQWKNMQSIYNEVSDPALIDTVIYQVMAAEQRYEYLLRLAKNESLTCENIPVR